MFVIAVVGTGMHTQGGMAKGSRPRRPGARRLGRTQATAERVGEEERYQQGDGGLQVTEGGGEGGRRGEQLLAVRGESGSLSF